MAGKDDLLAGEGHREQAHHQLDSACLQASQRQQSREDRGPDQVLRLEERRPEDQSHDHRLGGQDQIAPAPQVRVEQRAQAEQETELR